MSNDGTYVGKYLIKSKIAEGGMGAIYKAEHPTLNRTVILKRLTLKKNTVITERFKREAQLMLDFRNDNIVQVYDHFKEGNSYYIVMEYVDGVSLGDLIEKKRYIPNDIAMLIFREICKALKYAHDKNVIHRDIKPENILISSEGEIKLTDFGIATSKDSEVEGLTSAGMTLGTPAYMSPEQISDTKTVDKRTDIYSMGVVLYKMVTGKTPFPGNFTPDAINQINKGEYIHPRKINPRVTPLIQSVIKKAMHHKIKKRYKDLQFIIDIFSKALKKRFKDKETVNDAIKSFLSGKEMTDVRKVKKPETPAKAKEGKSGRSVLFVLLWIFIILVILAAILCGCAYYAYYKGMHYEYLKKDEYGALTVAIRVRTKDKNPGDDYIAASLYKIDGKLTKTADLEFFESPTEKTNDYFTLISGKNYFKTGSYRIFINYGSEHFQKDFFLNPRARQKPNKDTMESERLQFYYAQPLHLPLKINYSVYNAANNADITTETTFEIYSAKGWLTWEKFVKLKDYQDYFVTGKTFRFRFKKDEFYPVIRKIYVQPNETQLSLEIILAQFAGRLLLQSNYEGLMIFLNNSEYYISGGNYGQYIKIPPSSLKQQEFWLNPGDYFLTVSKSDKSSKTLKVTIEPDKSSVISAEYNKDNDSIELKEIGI